MNTRLEYLQSIAVLAVELLQSAEPERCYELLDAIEQDIANARNALDREYDKLIREIKI